MEPRTADPGGAPPWWQRPTLLIPLLLAVLFVPFAGKALHIDDIAFLRLGDMLGWNPLRATPTDYPYQGLLLRGFLPYEATHPLLIPWLLKLLRAVLGEDERLLHLAFLGFPALALWGLWRFHRLLLPVEPARAALLLTLFAATPAFLVNGQNLMSDVPTLGLLLAGAALLLDGARRQRGVPLWLGSLALGGALFSSYQVGVLLPALLPACWATPWRRRCLAALALPYLLLLVWLLLVWQRHGLFPLLASGTEANIAGELRRGLQAAVLADKGGYLLATLGAAAAPVFLASGAWRAGGRRGRIAAGCLAVLLLVAVFLLPGAQSLGWGGRVALWLLALLGGGALLAASVHAATMAADAALRPVALCLALWLGLALLANLLLLPFGAARYLLPALPPLFVLLLAVAQPPAAWLARSAVVAALGFGLACAASDYALAGCYRTMAGEVAQVRAGGNEVWYVGEWGMRYYFDRAGARYLPADSNAPRPGDLVVIPELPRFWVPAPALQERLQPLASREFAASLPLRLFNRRSSAGFYGHHWGMLPFALSRQPDEVFAIQQVGSAVPAREAR